MTSIKLRSSTNRRETISGASMEFHNYWLWVSGLITVLLFAGSFFKPFGLFLFALPASLIMAILAHVFNLAGLWQLVLIIPCGALACFTFGAAFLYHKGFL